MLLDTLIWDHAGGAAPASAAPASRAFQTESFTDMSSPLESDVRVVPEGGVLTRRSPRSREFRPPVLAIRVDRVKFLGGEGPLPEGVGNRPQTLSGPGRALHRRPRLLATSRP